MAGVCRRIGLYITLFAGLLLPGAALAQGDPNADRGQFDANALEGICMDVYRQRTDTSAPELYTYAYERRIYEAARIDWEVDTQDEARQKIQTMWLVLRDRFTCSGANFRVPNGNILKYAVETSTFNLIDNATRFWGLDLNLVDSADGATLLDYIASRVVDNQGNPAATVLTNLYDKVRRYGGRHCRELPDTSVCSERERTREIPRFNEDGSLQ